MVNDMTSSSSGSMVTPAPPEKSAKPVSEPASILISSPSLDIAVNVSGISSVVAELSKATQGTVDYEYVWLGAPYTGGFLRRRTASLMNIIAGVRKILSSGARIFHSNTAFDAKSIVRDSVLVAIAKACGKKVLLHVHGGRYVHERASGLVNFLISALLGMADRVVFLSAAEEALFRAREPRACAKMSFVYNSLDLSGIDEVVARRADEGPLRVAFIGRLVESKGIRVLLDVARECDPERVRITIHGDGPLRDVVDQAAAETPSLSNGALFPHSAWREVLGRYDVLLLPSESGEGAPMVILEAMALGVVPVTTPIASIPEIVEDGRRGVLMPPGDAAAALRALLGLADDGEKLSRLGHACALYAKSNFDVAVNSRRFVELYRSLDGLGRAAGDIQARPPR